MRYMSRPTTGLVVALTLSGCASLPRERGYAQTGDLVEARVGIAPRWSPDTPALKPEIPSAPLDADGAIRLAFLYNPRIREHYARLGLGRAELEEARRISNPAFGYSRLRSSGGLGSQITRSVSVGFTDLLLLPARKRFASSELDRLQKEIAAELLTLATDVEVAWYEAVGARQVASMRDVVAQAGERSADLAQRFFDAGNITRLQLEQELAAASQARIAAVRAGADSLRTRSALADLIGLPSDARWTVQDQLAAPPPTVYTADALVPLALDQRLDLAAARQAVVLREDALGVTRRWRWLGSVDVGYERESEVDGGVLRGPSLTLELPLFNQGQGAITRAQAELVDARAQLDRIALSVHNDARLGIAHLAVAHDIVERYRTALIPRREAIVARTQERVNFMLQGIFELIAARQQEYDVYQEYLEAVRDYWTARAQLRRVVGGRLPDDATTLEPTIGVESMLPKAEAPAMDHSMHSMPMPAEKPDAADPHAGHDTSMPADKPDAADPHSGHDMSKPKPADKPEAADPHAGHDMSMPMPADKPDGASFDADAGDAPQHGDTP